MPHTVPMPPIRNVVMAGLATAAILIATGWIGVQGILSARDDAARVSRVQEVLTASRQVLTDALVAEMSQRGFFISGQDAALDPYNAVVPRVRDGLAELDALVTGDAEQQAVTGPLRQMVLQRLTRLANNIELRREFGFEGALARIDASEGRAQVQAMRDQFDLLDSIERGRLADRAQTADRQYRLAVGSQVVLALISLVTLWTFARTVQTNMEARTVLARMIERDREQLRVTLGSIGDGVVTTDREARITMLNDVARHLTGWPGDEALGRPLSDVFRIVNEGDRTPVESPVQRALAQGVVVGLANHTTLIARDGTERPIADSAAPIRSADGTTVGAVLVFRDVTVQRGAEQQMRDALEYASTIVDTVREPLLVVTPDFTVRSASRSFYTEFATTPGAVEGHSVFDVGRDWPAAELRRWIEHAQASQSDVPPLEIVTAAMATGGTSVLRLHAGHLRHGARPTGLLLIAIEDISDQRAAEAARAGLLSKQTAWSARLQQVAAASLTIHGATTQDSVIEIIGAEAKRILGAGDCQVVFDATPANEDAGTLLVPMMGRESKVLGYIRCKDKAQGAFDGDDRATLSQLAHMASTAVENARLYGEMRQADVRKDEFLATLAHELRNPLAPINHALQVMRQSHNAVEQKTSREVIERQVRQLVHLVDDLLDVSRVSRGKLDLRTRPVTLAEVLNSSIETSRPLIDGQQHSLTVTLPPEPVWLVADLTRLAQVFANLLNNSAKYTEAGGHIAVTALVEGTQVVISVKDDGIGISADLLPHVFDVFRQAAHAGQRAQGGLGIGLTLVRRIVELHGGTVEARSDGLGKGSEFLVRLPVDVLSSATPAPPTAPANEEMHQMSLRVLVVDDNADSADTLAMLLKMSGHEVAIARDGYGAVDQTSAFRPDLILLDIGLPGINGYEAARQIRLLPEGATVQLVALTGWGQEEDRRRSKEAGFDQHLVKPVDFDALRNLIDSVQASRQ